MLIDTTLLVNDGPIIQGLADGSLKRWGGVIRNASDGRIVKHLLEAPGTTNVFIHGGTINMLNAAQRTLSSVLQISQVAAAASVLNLGVSVIGFAYMGYKLNQLQKSMSAMQERMDAGFDRVDAKIDAVAGQLNYLLLLAMANATEQRRIKESLTELHRAVLVAEIMELQSWLDHLSRFPGDSPKEAIRVASKVRRTLADQAVRVAPEFEPQVMLVADISIRGWAVAVATEAHLLMGLGQHGDARQLISEERPRFTHLAENWASALLADESPELQTAYRFHTPRFRDDVFPERVERIVRIHARDRGLGPERSSRAAREADIELEMSHNASLDEAWTRRQLALAEYLDGLSELNSRIESVGVFARECETRKLKSSRDLLPGCDVPEGIYLLTAADSE